MRRRPLLPLLPLAATLVWAACGDDPATPDDEDDPVPALLEQAAATITAADAAERTSVLADDSLRGRQTYRPEIEAAAAYLADQLDDMGLEPAGTSGFYHRFDFHYDVLDPETVLLETDPGNVVLEFGREYFFLASITESEWDVTGRVLWGGEAASAEPDPGTMAGRVVLYDLPASTFDFGLIEPMRTATIATQDDAAALGLVLGPEFTEDEIARATATARTWSRSLPTILLTEAAAERLLAEGGTDLATLRGGGVRDVDVSLRVRGWHRAETVTPPNVVALLRGSDAELGDEYVVLSAHFDHLGTGIPDTAGDSILNGADDNASGTAAVLAVAEAMAAANRAPARSVLFFLTSGEEWGKVGSTHFARDPTVPVEAMVANLNFDMVGRNVPGEIIASGMQYSGIGDRLATVAAEQDHLGITVVPDDPDPPAGYYLGSDNTAFACQGIPAFLFTSGLHEDYHEMTDELAKLDPDKIARVAALAFYLAWNLADEGDSPAWTAAGEAMLDELRCQLGPGL